MRPCFPFHKLCADFPVGNHLRELKKPAFRLFVIIQFYCILHFHSPLPYITIFPPQIF